MTMTPVEIQRIIQHDLGPYLVAGTRYPRALPVELAPWYAYVVDGGHCIVVVMPSQVQPGQPLTDYLVPAPVKAVLRIGYTVDADGYIWCDLPYDDTLGLVTDPGDDEF